MTDAPTSRAIEFGAEKVIELSVGFTVWTAVIVNTSLAVTEPTAAMR